MLSLSIPFEALRRSRSDTKFEIQPDRRFTRGFTEGKTLFVRHRRIHAFRIGIAMAGVRPLRNEAIEGRLAVNTLSPIFAWRCSQP